MLPFFGLVLWVPWINALLSFLALGAGAVGEEACHSVGGEREEGEDGQLELMNWELLRHNRLDDDGSQEHGDALEHKEDVVSCGYILLWGSKQTAGFLPAAWQWNACACLFRVGIRPLEAKQTMFPRSSLRWDEGSACSQPTLCLLETKWSRILWILLIKQHFAIK